MFARARANQAREQLLRWRIKRNLDLSFHLHLDVVSCVSRGRQDERGKEEEREAAEKERVIGWRTIP